MATKIKIKIFDNADLRLKIDELFEQSDQINIAIWAIKCARHILDFVEIGGNDKDLIENGFMINGSWQIRNTSVHEVRQTAFRIHELAGRYKDELTKTAIRTAGHAVAAAHMKEHAMVCSDYAIKTIQLAFPGNSDKIKEERDWQLNELKKTMIS